MRAADQKSSRSRRGNRLSRMCSTGKVGYRRRVWGVYDGTARASKPCADHFDLDFDFDFDWGSRTGKVVRRPKENTCLARELNRIAINPCRGCPPGVGRSPAARRRSKSKSKSGYHPGAFVHARNRPSGKLCGMTLTRSQSVHQRHRLTWLVEQIRETTPLPPAHTHPHCVP